jgi:hypothetical protein
MKNAKTQWIVVCGVICILIFTFFLFIQHRKTKFSWVENYKYKNKQPYGANILYQLLENSYADLLTPITRLYPSVLTNAKGVATTYILIGNTATFREENLNALADFVHDGNTAFLCLGSFPLELLKKLELEDCNSSYRYPSSQSVLNFDVDNLHDKKGYVYEYIYENKETLYFWQYFNDIECESKYKVTSIGYIQPTETWGDGYNFIKVNYGKGIFYLHCSPLAFSNLHLLDNKKLEYAEKVLSVVLTDAQQVLWDDYSKIDSSVNKGPLQYILSQPGLSHAWILMLVGVMVYFVFYSKRKQRVIPVLPTNTNSSIEFAETVGRLYLQHDNHYRMAKYKLDLFLAYIRRHYHIHVLETDKDFRARLSQRAAVPITLINDIFSTFEELNQNKYVSQKELKTFNQFIENFYKQCK